MKVWLSLQKKDLDICTAYNEADKVKLSLSQVRQNIDVVSDGHGNWKGNRSTRPSIPQCCGRQSNRSNVPGDSPEVYYQRLITVPFIDELMNHLETRFSVGHAKVVSAMKRIIPAFFATSTGDMGTMTVKSCLPMSAMNTSILDDFEFYLDDLPAVDNLAMEMDNWVNKWRRFKGGLPNSPIDCLSHDTESMYPNIHCILHIYCTLLVTTAECERSVLIPHSHEHGSKLSRASPCQSTEPAHARAPSQPPFTRPSEKASQPG